MLLEFKTKNYKSFLEEITFSMIKAPKQRDLSYSIMKAHIDKKSYDVLSSAVIYGPNAAGKSNIVGAMDVLRNVVIRGHILNTTDKIPNKAVCSLELIPNNSAKKMQPVDFYIKFIDDNFLFEYKLSLQLGMFIDMKTPRKILNEELYINNNLIFQRDDIVRFGENLSIFKKHISPQVINDRETIDSLAVAGLNDTELFLNNGFKNIISPIFAKQILDWFAVKFITIYDSTNYEAFIDKNSFHFEKSKVYSQDFINDISHELGIGSNMIGYVLDDNDHMVLTSIIKDSEKTGKILQSKIFESVGTVKFIHFIYPILSVLKNGGTLVVDELDSSLHTMIIMNLIGIFHNDEVNVNKAQLIFTTHNPMYMNSSVYRRDEIKFVDRDENGCSTHYSLSDIVFTEKQKVRSCADYMKNYFINRYGAIKEIDLTSDFERLISNKALHIHEKIGPGHGKL